MFEIVLSASVNLREGGFPSGFLLLMIIPAIVFNSLLVMGGKKR